MTAHPPVPVRAPQEALPALTCSRSNRSDCALFETSSRPSKEWYAEKIAETEGLDSALPCGALAATPPSAAPAGPLIRNDPLSALSIRLLVSAGHVTQEKADEAFSIACQCLEAEADKMNAKLPWVTRRLPPPGEVQVDAARELERLQALINTPQTEDWLSAVELEAAHQQERWGAEHDEGKEPQDWYWLLGYLGGKAVASFAKGDTEKGLHHTISSGAVLLNWHRHATGQMTGMRPGIADPDAAIASTTPPVNSGGA